MEPDNAKIIANIQEKSFRLNIVKNFKGELKYDYTVRADSYDQLEALTDKVDRLAKKRCKE